MNNTIAWMISGGRRFDDAWEDRTRQRAALVEARGRGPALVARLFARAAAPLTASDAPAVPACCPA